ncbi:GCN5 family acetyltransferase [Lecanosticta acicola]|uniref:GCN5 family acetyltransferase n=1 Tax=Lecanosticta acicola TaxID=111012 RepID=A0AAI9E9S7_9PEZI|nr:GCN5 family acetyltransferase [Lecanosticta acicola]
MPPSTPFTIRPATIAASDHELLIDFQQSQIAWLSSVGSSDQWGTGVIRETNPRVSDTTRAWIERSEHKAPWSSEWCRAFVAETSSGTPAAGMVLESKSNNYTRDILPEQDPGDPFVYLAYLISNRNAGSEAKGAGAALIALAREQTLAAGVKRICVDCWAGNHRHLVK